MSEQNLTEAELHRRISLADQLEKFIASDIGQHFNKRIEKIERNAEIEFRNVDPDDTNAVRKVQNKLLVCDEIRRFITEAFEDGRSAVVAIMDDEQAE